MKLHDLKPSEGSKKDRRRVGRGISAGQGKTAGRGTKGQLARSGGGKPPYFEGGQLPLVRRLPFKRGFTNVFRLEYQEVNIGRLAERFDSGAEVAPEDLLNVRLVSKRDLPVVVLGMGEVDKPLTVRAHRFSKSAQEKIEAAGGTAEVVQFPVPKVFATVKKVRKEKRTW